MALQASIATRWPRVWLGLPSAVGIWMLASCTTTPDTVPKTVPVAKPALGKQQFHERFDGPLLLDYEVDTKLSAIDGKSCYSFLTGSLANQSRERLSRQTEVHFRVYHDHNLLFSDIARLRTDLPPGHQVQFQMVESPVHMKHCPSYDRIEVFVNKIALP